MNNIQLERTLRLLRRTGDKAVVVDPGSDEVFMLMNLDAYEGLLDEIDGRILPENSSGADTLSDEDDLTLGDALSDDFEEAPTAAEELDSAENYTPVERLAYRQAGCPTPKADLEKLDFSENWPKKADSSLENEESLEDVPDEGEEEKFYLEPVE